jgi:hypothetical protein
MTWGPYAEPLTLTAVLGGAADAVLTYGAAAGRFIGKRGPQAAAVVGAFATGYAIGTAIDNTFIKEHTKDARKSTEERHEKGKARKERDRGGEKGDERRGYPRKPPPGWKGPWPPKGASGAFLSDLLEDGQEQAGESDLCD